MCGVGHGGGNPGEQGAGGVQETGDERARGGISTMAGSGREIQKGKFLLFVTAYFHLTFSEAYSKILYTRKSKNEHSCSG